MSRYSNSIRFAVRQSILYFLRVTFPRRATTPPSQDGPAGLRIIHLTLPTGILLAHAEVYKRPSVRDQPSFARAIEKSLVERRRNRLRTPGQGVGAMHSKGYCAYTRRRTEHICVQFSRGRRPRQRESASSLQRLAITERWKSELRWREA